MHISDYAKSQSPVMIARKTSASAANYGIVKVYNSGVAFRSIRGSRIGALEICDA